MKMPRERVQLWVAAGVLGMALCYAVIQFALVPMFRNHGDARREIRDLESRIADASAEVARLPMLRERDEELRAELLRIHRVHVLEPEFGNYLIRAQQGIERLAAAANLRVDSVGGVGEQSMPQHGTRRNAFRLYLVRVTARVSGERGYEDLLTFLKTVESGNPYSIVSSVQIGAQPDFAQGVGLSVSWPIWEDPLISKSFEPRAAGSDPAGESPAPAGKERT